MRLTSNKESVAKGEVSVLAIIETLLAIALVFYLSSHFNTLRWLAGAMCVAPLLLLRTKESTRLGLLFLGWCIHKSSFKEWNADEDDNFITKLIYEFRSIIITVVNAIIWWFIFVPTSTAARLSATSYTFLRSPASGIKAIPQNWVRVTLAMDSMFPPELMPGAQCWNWNRFFANRHRNSLRENVVLFTVLGPLFIPALFYRWSLKATSIIYAPLVFVAHSTFSESSDLRMTLELIKRGDLSRIRALYGIVVIAAFLVKLVLMIKWNGFLDVWKGNPIVEFLALYVAPSEIPKWQLAEVANSVLAVGAMLFARHALLRYELNNPWPEIPVKRILGFVSGLRWVLALYAIVCLGYITMREAQHLHWPVLGTKWLPW